MRPRVRASGRPTVHPLVPVRYQGLHGHEPPPHRCRERCTAQQGRQGRALHAGGRPDGDHRVHRPPPRAPPRRHRPPPRLGGGTARAHGGRRAAPPPCPRRSGSTPAAISSRSGVVAEHRRQPRSRTATSSRRSCTRSRATTHWSTTTSDLAWAGTRVFCLLNGRDLRLTVGEAEELVLAVAQGHVDVPEIATLLRERLRRASA